MDIVGLLGDTCEKAGKTADARAQFLRYYELAAKTLRMNPEDPKTSTTLKEFAAVELFGADSVV